MSAPLLYHHKNDVYHLLRTLLSRTTGAGDGRWVMTDTNMALRGGERGARPAVPGTSSPTSENVQYGHCETLPTIMIHTTTRRPHASELNPLIEMNDAVLEAGIDDR